ncbi:hypothetical protein [Muricoccus radiodurans]|uniref:hypothetical protein n=1 Tax=Muricoccus radiodurans TaxID=2231721 RepID=UPI003CF6AE17
MPSDQLRRVLCLVLPFVQILTSLLSRVGIGRSVGEVTAASWTPVIPAGYAFIIWAVLFALSVAYGVWQFLPANHGSALARRTGWPLIGVFLLNSLWQTVAQLSSAIGFGLVLILLLALACALVALFLGRNATEEPGIGPRWIVAPLVGLMAGWLTAAAFANVSAASRALGVTQSAGFGATVAAVVLLLAAGGTAAAIVSIIRGASAWFAVGAGWAFAWIVAANLGLNQLNIPAALAAALMLVLVAAAAWQGRRVAA